MKEIVANQCLQERIEDAIRSRQSGFKDLLWPQDVIRVTRKAIKEIIKENRADALALEDES